MKKNKFWLLLAVVLLFSCSPGNHWKLKIEMPGESVVDLSQFKEIVITNFLIKNQTKDIDLSQEIKDYLITELGQNYEGKIISQKISIENEEAFQDEEYWRTVEKETESSLILTGTADYREEIRKAILEEKRGERFEGPFSPERKLAERKFYTLELDIFLIEGQSGQTLYKRDFKEVKGYKNPNQTAFYAFFDLIQRVKVKFFGNILGGKKIEERYLISQ